MSLRLTAKGCRREDEEGQGDDSPPPVGVLCVNGWMEELVKEERGGDLQDQGQLKVTENTDCKFNEILK